MTGGALFNEVFFDGARTPADWIVGERGLGLPRDLHARKNHAP